MDHLSGYSESRRALIGAFGRLVLDRPFEQISVSAIVAAAGVARSTFYEHYRSKDDLLVDATAPLFAILAATVDSEDPEPLIGLLRHFEENRAMARAVLEDRAARELVTNLAERIRDRMEGTADGQLIAMQVAGGQLELIRAWLAGRVRAAPAALAESLLRFTRRAVSPARSPGSRDTRRW